MKIGLIVPGGVDHSGEVRVIPALLALIRQFAREHEVHVFALRQEPQPATWTLHGAHIHNAGEKRVLWRTASSICAEHRRAAFDILQSIWSGKCGFLAVSCALVLRVPCAVHVAGGELQSLNEISYGGRRHWRGRLREALVLRMASAVTTASAPMIDKLTELGIAADRVPLGIDLDFWVPRAPQRRDLSEPIRLIHVASLNRVKDQTTLLKSLAIVMSRGSRFRLDVVGEDTLDGAIHSLCADLGLQDRVRFHGFLTQRELRPLMLSAHVLLVSSRHEAGPVAMLEAATLGIPTVGTAVGHVAEWAPDAAVSVPVADANALADAICEISNDEGRRLALARNAQHRAVANDAEFCATQFISLYRRILTSGSGLQSQR